MVAAPPCARLSTKGSMSVTPTTAASASTPCAPSVCLHPLREQRDRDQQRGEDHRRTELERVLWSDVGRRLRRRPRRAKMAAIEVGDDREHDHRTITIERASCDVEDRDDGHDAQIHHRGCGDDSRRDAPA